MTSTQTAMAMATALRPLAMWMRCRSIQRAMATSSTEERFMEEEKEDLDDEDNEEKDNAPGTAHGIILSLVFQAGSDRLGLLWDYLRLAYWYMV